MSHRPASNFDGRPREALHLQKSLDDLECFQDDGRSPKVTRLGGQIRPNHHICMIYLCSTKHSVVDHIRVSADPADQGKCKIRTKCPNRGEDPRCGWQEMSTGGWPAVSGAWPEIALITRRSLAWYLGPGHGSYDIELEASGT